MNANNISDLSQIGAEFQQHKKLLLRQKIWRSIFISSIAGGLCWGFTVPKWEILDSSQVILEGNSYLAKSTIVDRLKITYPISLWEVQTGKMRQNLIYLPPIAEVRVTRQMLPPALKIALQEKIPVAVSLSPLPANNSPSGGKQQQGFLDRHGNWLPQSFYANTSAKLPTLQVKGYRQQDRSIWQKLYSAIETSPIKFLAIDWGDRNNLILYTQLGKVYLGACEREDEIKEKLRILENMGKLSQQIPPDRLDYIDLTNIREPKVKEIMKKKVEQK